MSRSRLVAVGAIVAVAIAAVASTTFVSIEEAADAAPEAFDPAAFAEANYDELVVTYVDAEAHDLVELLDALDGGADEADFGHAPGDASSFSFPVRFTGVAGELDGSTVPITVVGVDDEITVVVQVGPALSGVALRDVSGDITFGQFTNQLEFQQVGGALNEIVKDQVLADVDATDLAGAEVTVVGAFTRVNPGLVSVVPIAIEVTP